MAKKTPAKADNIEIIKIKQETMTFCVVGETPLIFHRLSNQAREQLLLPPKKKNRAEQQATPKHDPIAEFRASIETRETGPTLLALLSTAFKGALRSVAVDMPGATKAQIGRLCYVDGHKVSIYGIPKLFMAPVRNSGMNRTPDIRTRAIIDRWAAFVDLRYTVPMLNLKTINALFQASGMIVGVGDWRPEKGSGNFGTFRVVDADDEEFRKIVETSGRDAQEAAMLRAEPFDADSEELLSWFVDEAGTREFEIAK